jgi:hypothetical protein
MDTTAIYDIARGELGKETVDLFSRMMDNGNIERSVNSEMMFSFNI